MSRRVKKIVLYSLLLFFLCRCRHKNILTCNEIERSYFRLTDSTLSNTIKKENRQDIEISLASNANCIVGYISLADIFYNIDSVDKSYNLYRHALSIDSTNIYANYMCGLVNEISKSYQNSITYYQRAISLKIKDGFIVNFNPNFADVSGSPTFDVSYSKLVLRRGICYYLSGDFLNSFYDLNYCINKREF
ncbi:MAG: hypothetical protein ABI480_14090, partial [Chitinophagaceae bacterium]